MKTYPADVFERPSSYKTTPKVNRFNTCDSRLRILLLFRMHFLKFILKSVPVQDNIAVPTHIKE